MTSNETFSDWALQPKSEDSAQPFPFLYEDEDGDRAEFLFNDEDRLAERVDGRLTIYRGRESGDIVGGSIKGLKQLRERLLREFDGFAFCVKEGRVELVIVFAATLLKQKDEVLSMHYRTVFDQIRLHGISLSIDSTSNGDDTARLCKA